MEKRSLTMPASILFCRKMTFILYNLRKISKKAFACVVNIDQTFLKFVSVIDSLWVIAQLEVKKILFSPSKPENNFVVLYYNMRWCILYNMSFSGYYYGIPSIGAIRIHTQVWL